MGLLSGIRVLDFGRYVAGPYCATLLGYLGAEVIRIEKLGGSEDRYIAPLFTRPDGGDGEGGVFMQMNCNKKGFTLDPKTDQGREIIRKLVASSDVIVVNLPLKALKKLGLDYLTLKAIRPDIILTMVSAFGSTGPWASKGGFDGIAQAVSGAMFMTGEPGEPVKAAAPYCDNATGLAAAFGTLAAIMHRQKTGEGQVVEATLQGSALSAFNSHLIEQGATAINRQPSGNRVQTSAPSDVFATRDGHILMHVVGGQMFRCWCDLVGVPEWIDDPRFQTDQARGDHRQIICERMAQWCQQHTTDNALDAIDCAGLPAGPVLSLQQAIDHPQVEAMGFLQQMMFPGMKQPAPVADIPVKLSGLEVGITARPPVLGEHTDELLAELGYAEDAIERLRQQKVV